MSDPETTIDCGPFELFERIGTGGMGEVWRARHRRDDRRAALKVLLAERAQDAEYERAFRREAHALARLNHPSIATVYDYGRIEASAAAAGLEAFVEGAPWLAMEYVEGEPIGASPFSWQWSGLREQLFQLLDALAHAHAKHVLHRDLKPSNVLVRSDGRVRIVDFGVAAVFRESAMDDAAGADGTIRGTPSYMAPEQIRGEWRNQGPWTDLYAIGCIAWHVVCGTPPVEGETTDDVIRNQLLEGPSGYQPIFDVPSGLYEWLVQLLVKQPGRRYRRAADAAWGLAALPEPNADSETSDGAPPGDGETIEDSYGPTLRMPHRESGDDPMEATTQVSSPFQVDGSGPSSLETPRGAGETPPISPHWQRHHDEAPAPLSASGVELFGLRRLPTVDRVDERDHLWEALREVHDRGEPAAVMLEGPPGSGKSKLAEWLRCRAEEVGAAIGLRVDHSPTGGPADGIEAALARHFRLDGLRSSDAVDHLTDRLEALDLDRSDALYDAHGIVGASELGDQMEGNPGFENRRERHFALRRVFGGLARERPVVLWLDDIPLGRESAAFVEFLFDTSLDGELPVLVVMTARRRELEDHPEVRALIDRSLTAEGGRRLEIAPLERADQRKMIRRMLRFDAALTDEIVERTEGRPLFAVQLVTSWLERGVLEAGDDGFVVAEGARPTMPEDLNALWIRRVREVAGRYPESVRRDVWSGLEQAAAFGRRVDRDEWRLAMEYEGCEPPADLRRRLVEVGLAEPTDTGWQFVHGLAVEALRQRARDEGRVERLHRHCAEAILDAYPNHPKETAERRAEHLREAGDRQQALALLFDAAEWSFNRSDYEEHSQLVERCEAVVEALDLPGDDRRRARLALERSRNHSGRGNVAEATDAVDRAIEMAQRHDWELLYGRGCLVRSYLLRLRGDGEEAIRWIDRAEDVLERVGDIEDEARCLECRASILVRLFQNYDRAMDLFEVAREKFRRAGFQQRVLLCDYIFASIEFYAGNLEASEAQTRGVLAEASERGDRFRQASAYNLLGEIARHRGAWNDARSWYDEARHLWASCGARDAVIPELNVAMIDVFRGELADAEPQLRELLDRLPEAGLAARLAPVYLGLVACRAQQGDWEDVDHHIDRSRRHLDEYDYRMSDQAEMAERAAEVVREYGAPERAARLEQIADRVWADLEGAEQ